MHRTTRHRLLLAMFLGANVSQAAAEEWPSNQDLVLWLRADTGVVLQAAGVMTWQDQSGHGAHAVQLDTNRMPSLVSAAFSNGMPAIRFTNSANSAVDKRLDGPSVVSGAEARTIFVVARQVAGALASYPAILELGRDGLATITGSVYRITPEVGVRVYNASVLFTNHPLDHQFRILTVQNPGNARVSDITLALDGLPAKRAAVVEGPLVTNGDGYRIGDSDGVGGSAFMGDLAEILVYRRRLDAVDVNAVGHYLETRYGLKTSCVSTARQARAVRVWFLIGQSNMRGHGNPALVTDPTYQAAQGDVMHWHNQDNEVAFQGTGKEYGWEPLKWNSGRTETEQYGGFGPELSFGRTMMEAFPDRRLALIKHAIGGTSLSVDWNVASGGSVYLDFLETAHAALAALTNEGYAAELEGMLWMQGENDTGSAATAQAYATNLTALIRAIRLEFDAPGMAFALGRTRGTSGNAVTVRNAQKNVAEQDPLGAWVSVDDLALVNYDTVHLNTASQLEFGRRLARAYLERIHLRDTSAVQSAPGGGVRLAWGSLTGETYRVLFSSDLRGEWAAADEDLLATPPDNVHTAYPGDSAQGFYRVERQP